MMTKRGFRRLSAQLKAKKLVVKLFLRHPLHAKLYLIHRTDPNNPATGFLGQQQSDVRRLVEARRTERRCPRSRRLQQTAKMV